MTKETTIKLFKEKQVRSAWNQKEENGTSLSLMLLQYLRQVLTQAHYGES